MQTCSVPAWAPPLCASGPAGGACTQRPPFGQSPSAAHSSWHVRNVHTSGLSHSLLSTHAVPGTGVLRFEQAEQTTTASSNASAKPRGRRELMVHPEVARDVSSGGAALATT